jgi:hypothetical protein
MEKRLQIDSIRFANKAVQRNSRQPVPEVRQFYSKHICRSKCWQKLIIFFNNISTFLTHIF